ncbi:MAG: DNA polymerase III subunit delta' C-terminal domain-containing protein [Enterobacteriaceae bacterium]
MLNTKTYPWITSIYSKIIKYYKNNIINKPLFIYSFKGNGTNIILKNVILWLICKNKNYNNCGICNNCNLMKTGNYPDYYIINNNININNINNLIDFIYIKSQKNNNKIIYLPKIELFDNFIILKLLKLLKLFKKKKNIFFIIRCSNFFNFFLEFKKNCFYLNINNPGEKISLNWLKKKNKNAINEIKTALYLNNYSPLLANKMLSSNIWDIRKKIYNLIFDMLINKNNLFIFEMLESKNLKLYIYWLYTIITDIIKIKYKCNNYITNQDQKKKIINLSNVINLNNLFLIIKKINKLEYKIKNIKNINIKILLIEIFIFLKTITNFKNK